MRFEAGAEPSQSQKLPILGRRVWKADPRPMTSVGISLADPDPADSLQC